MKVVRQSHYRHLFGEPVKDVRFEDLRLSSKATESCGIRGNGLYCAFPWEAGGGSTLAVLPLAKPGRMPRDLPLISGHHGPVLDFEFNPFDDSMLMSTGEDMTLKLWQVPEGGLKAHLKDPLLSIEAAHAKKIQFCTFNPCAMGIAATTSFDMKTKFWNLEEQEEFAAVEMAEQVVHMKWNYSGSLLATTCKDKKLRLIDPRSKSISAETKAHDGVKPMKLEWLGSGSATDECYKLITTGFTTQAERQIGVWDIRKLGTAEDSEPLFMHQLDVGTGCLFPFFDPCAQLLFVAGKGDANCRFFEADVAEPYLHFISDYSTTCPQKGFDFLPKRCVDTTKHECMRGLKLEANAVSLVSFKVSRKSDAFQEDLYPDAPNGNPSMSGKEWMDGADRGPALSDMKSLVAGGGSAAKKGGGLAVVSVKDLKAELAEAKAKIAALEKENAALKEELAELKK
eukprot:CAMPEP_0206465720 /NCGR_PEP_ID=MMETSP0324_2-20121206/28011_1 /ASSEMBLY_ACC=CAM_ASM_000836 /TAXON_ID=2866 /ORGANISM="Crypthecodinium cohnii, Strain Seligo" /LENGTH=453 /DNA_ID=CAMNT_0053938659 /DNA_START=49 /DNA_END=1410 /DNA_ORIENTATION=+